MDETTNVNVNPGSDNGGTGALIGSIIVIILIVLAGIYFLTANKDEGADTDTNTDETEQIEEDLDGTDADVDDELNTIDAELDASASTTVQ